MIVFESTKGRRFVGRIERGESLVEAISLLLRERGVTSAWLTVLGALEWADLARADQVGGAEAKPVRVEECEILHLAGNVSLRRDEPSVRLHGAVSRVTSTRHEVVAGRVVDARVYACEFHVSCFDDVLLKREYDAATGLDLWAGDRLAAPVGDDERGFDGRVTNPPPQSKAQRAGGPAGAPTGGSTGGTGDLSWAQVAAAAHAAAVQQPASSGVEQMPQIGDMLDHKSFGLCRVEGRGTDGALIIRLPNDPRRKKISVEHFEFVGPRSEGGRRVFALRRRG
jgi:predicted DNA-binding protein with PD1-like motif